MGEYEPRDSRNVTLKDKRAPGEPPRTGPREAQARAGLSELEGDERGETAESDAVRRERAIERDTAELSEGMDEEPSPGKKP